MKRLAFTLLICSCAFSSYTQVTTLNFGFNSSNMRAGDNDNIWSKEYENNTNFYIGLTIEFDLQKNLFLEAGALYQHKGFTSDDIWIKRGSPFSPANSENIFRIERGLNYLDIPLQLKHKYKVCEKLKLFISSGVYVGLLLSSREKNVKDYETSGYIESKGIEITDNI